ncbi:hypothetical protein BDP81DRAFT_323700 [Colletotrichum phormii]|uniref:F-box domain-containing protein n=1 Tax=Colletotrichum phormii TaxID=359342 RepID=A0AAJ0ECD6_9PEZI|nr:uncharacterized protein BDP81DRAFT_323700 [Colletotrichum phormii]KAK1634627.1 hypothetical protein BDP81DRAFT_323700 [Colletotrichum phormii]
MSESRFLSLPPEVLLEICRHLAAPMQKASSSHWCRFRVNDSSGTKTRDPDVLACGVALARLIRTCKAMHSVAGCMLYPGYYNIRHPSEAFTFFPSFPPRITSRSRRTFDNGALNRGSEMEIPSRPQYRELVGHVQIHNDSTLDMDCSEEQMSSLDADWLTNAADRLGISFPNDWNKCRLECGPQDHVAKYIAQLLLRYLPNLLSLKVTLTRPWKFTLLKNWIQTNEIAHNAFLWTLKNLTIHLRSIEARSSPSHRIILNSASYLTTLHVHDTCSFRIPKGIRLEHLRSLTFASCSMDRSSMKNALQATPKLISFEYHARPSTAQNTHKRPLLTPRMLCQLLSNDFDRTEPPLRNGRGEVVSAVLPEFHRQLRMLVIDFPVGEDESTWWKREETIANMRDFRLLKHLSIDAGSITCRSQGGGIIVNDLNELIPEKLEGLAITRVGECFDYLVQTSLPELSRELRNGRSSSLHRVGILHCAIDEFTRYNALHSLRRLFVWRIRIGVCNSWFEGEISKVTDTRIVQPPGHATSPVLEESFKGFRDVMKNSS